MRKPVEIAVQILLITAFACLLGVLAYFWVLEGVRVFGS